MDLHDVRSKLLLGFEEACAISLYVVRTFTPSLPWKSLDEVIAALSLNIRPVPGNGPYRVHSGVGHIGPTYVKTSEEISGSAVVSIFTCRNSLPITELMSMLEQFHRE
jgi:hypothetical protein